MKNIFQIITLGKLLKSGLIVATILLSQNAISATEVVGEYRFDDCGSDEWKHDHSTTANDATGTPSIIQNDFKSYACNSIENDSWNVSIPDHAAYDINEGAISILVYDHHNIWANTRLVEKGWDASQKIRLGFEQVGDDTHGTVTANLNGNTINTGNIYFTTANNGTDNDTQWLHVLLSFGSQGMKLYVNGNLEGTNAYTGGINGIPSDFAMPALSGYFDEFDILKGQPSDAEVATLYNNLTTNKNLNGTNRDCGCGATVLGSIAGTIYTDANGNDHYDTGVESGIPSITVSLFDDKGTASTADDTQITTTSSTANGGYSFSSIDASLTYRIEVDTNDADLPAGATIGTTNPITGVTPATGSKPPVPQNFGFDVSTSCSQALNFQNPVLESGVNKQTGAIYRFSNVDTGVDALVEILNVSNANIGALDDTSSGLDAAFQPELMMSQSAGASIPDQHVDFEIRFVNAGTNTAHTLSTVYATAVDIDGDDHGTREYTILSNADTYTLENPTNLQNISSGRFTPITTVNNPGINLSDTQQMFTATYKNVSSIRYTTGFSNDGTDYSSYHRQSSLSFECVNYNNPQYTGNISGTVFTDNNTNNQYDAGSESGIPAITVTLYDDKGTASTADDTQLATTSSAADGSYSFTALSTSLSYRIEVDTTDADLPANSTLGTTNPLTGVAVTANNTTADQDFGFETAIQSPSTDYGDAPANYAHPYHTTSDNNVLAAGQSSISSTPDNLCPQTDFGIIALHQTDTGRLFVGGQFTKFNGLNTTGSGLTEINPISCNTIDFNFTTNNRVTAIDSYHNFLIIAGDFSQVNGEDHQGVAIIDLDNNTLLPWNPGINRLVHTIAIDKTRGRLHIGGDFGYQQYDIFNISSNSSVFPSLLSSNQSVVFDLHYDQQADRIFMGGSFTNMLGNSQADYFASLNLENNTLDTTPSFNNVIYSISSKPGKRVYLLGDFSNVAGNSRDGLAALDLPSLNLNANWKPTITIAANPSQDNNSESWNGKPNDNLQGTRYGYIAARIDYLNEYDVVISRTNMTELAGSSIQDINTSDLNSGSTNSGAVHPDTGQRTDWSASLPTNQANATIVANHGLLAVNGNVYLTASGGLFARYGLKPEVEKLYLGDLVDNEASPQPSANADGDGADEDGIITPLDNINIGDTAYSVDVKVTNNTSKTGYVTAWIDFNKDGLFQSNEANNGNISIADKTTGVVTLTWNNTAHFPISNSYAGKTYLRVRLSTNKINKNADATTLASPDGEIEDYSLKITSTSQLSASFDCTNKTQATWQNDNPTTTDWIGIYNATEQDTTKYLDWYYLNGSKTTPTSTSTSGTITFSQNLPAGDYKTILFKNNGYTVLKSSNTFSITNCAEAFTCTSNLYQSSNLDLNITNQMGLYKINRSTNPYTMDQIGNTYNQTYNALAYRLQDNFIYASYQNTLLRIGGNGVIDGLGTIVGLPANTQYYAGTMDADGFYYIGGIDTAKSDKIYKIDVTATPPRVIDTITLSRPIYIWDFVFINNSLYGTEAISLTETGNLLQIAMDGTITEIGQPLSAYSFGSAFTDSTGNFFAIDDNGGGFFKIDINTGVPVKLSEGIPSRLNDGASCATATIPAEQPDLSLKKRLSNGQANTVNPNNTVTFTLDVTNEGTTAVRNIELVDYIPRALTLNDPNWTSNATGDQATLNTPIPTLAAGATASVNISFTANTSLVTRSVQPRIGGIIKPEEEGCKNAAEIKAFLGGTDSDSTPDDIPDNDHSEDDYDVANINVTGVCSGIYDYGDAPDNAEGSSKNNYQTQVTDNGARHSVSTQLYLGNCVDTDDGDLQNTLANADDSQATSNKTIGNCSVAGDDEDGITPPQLADSQIAPSFNAKVFNNTGLDAVLYCWADYNGDGVFDNATERGQATVASASTTQNVTLTLPDVPSTAGYDTGGNTYLRCRIATGEGASNSTGSAADGEVEDYPLVISTHCTINATTSNIQCDDKGTSNPNDDTWSFDTVVNAAGVTGTDWLMSGDHSANGTYGQNITLPVGLISAKSELNLQINDALDSSCKTIKQVTAPPSCSSNCGLFLNQGTITTDDKGTASTADDELSVEVAISGVTPANSSWTASRKVGANTYTTIATGSGSQTTIFTVKISDIIANDLNGYTLRVKQDNSDCFVEIYINLPNTNTLEVNKTVQGDPAPDNWEFTLTSSNCNLPVGLSNPASVSGAGGSTSFTNLDVYDNTGQSCLYALTENTQTGYALDSASSDSLTNIVLTQNSTKVVNIVNDQQAYLFVDDASVVEGNSGEVKLNFPIIRSSSSTRNLSNSRASSTTRTACSVKNVNESFNTDVTQTWTAVNLTNRACSWSMSGNKLKELTDVLFTGCKGFLNHPVDASKYNVDSDTYNLRVTIDSNYQNSISNWPKDNNGVGIVFGYQDQDNYYLARWLDYGNAYQTLSGYHYRYLQLIKQSNGSEILLGEKYLDLPEVFEMKVDVSSVGIKLYIDNNLEFQASSRPILNAFGLYTIDNDDGIYYDNFKAHTECPSAQNNNINIPVSTNFAITAGTASEGVDYQTVADGIATIPAGATSINVSVPVIGDLDVEDDETFTIHLSNSELGIIVDGDATGTIIDDDAVTPAISITDNSIIEGDSGTKNLNFTVTLSSAAPAGGVSIAYTAADGTATTSNNDYQSVNNGTLTIAEGDTTGTISVAINGDTNVEPDETFTLNLSNPSNATLADNQATGTILNDDILECAANTTIWLVDEDEDTTQSLWAFNNLDENLIGTNHGSLKWRDPADGTLHPLSEAHDMEAMASNIYTGQIYLLSSGHINDGPSSSQSLWTYNLNNIETDSGNIVLTLLGHITRVHGYGAESLAFDPNSKRLYMGNPVDGNQNNSTVTDELYYIDLTTLHTDVMQRTDPILVGTVQGAGHTNNYIDSMEFDENGNLYTSDGTDQHLYRIDPTTGAILELVNSNILADTGNDTDIESLSWDHLNNRMIAVDNDSQRFIEVSLSNGSNQIVSTFGNVSGITGSVDFESSAIFLNCDPVKVGMGNTVFIDANSNGTFDSGEGVDGVTVQLFVAGDDPTTAISVTDTVTSGGGLYQFTGLVEGSYFAHIPATMFASGQPLEGLVSVTGNGSDNSLDDDTDENGIDTVTPASTGVSSSTIILTPSSEAIDTSTETGNHNTDDNALDNNNDWTVDFGFTTPTPAISIADNSVTEGNSGTKNLNFTVTLSSAAPAGGVSIAYTTANGTATTSNNDYQSVNNGTLTIAEGDTTGTISVAINGDTNVENDETFQLNLSSPVGGVIADSQAIGTILNDDTTLTPVAEYRFDQCSWDGSANEVLDSTSYANHGTALNGANTSNDAILGYSADFNGANKVEIPNQTQIEIGKNNADFAVTFWLKLQQSNTGSWRSITQKGNSGQRTFAMWMRPSDNRVHHRISTTSSWNAGGDSVAAMPIDTWTHIAYVKIGNKLYFYVNGALDRTSTLSNDVISNNSPLRIGGNYGSTGTNSRIDEYKIFDTALTDADVLSIYTNESNGLNYDGSSRNAISCGSAPSISIADNAVTEGDSGTKNLDFTVTLDSPAPVGGISIQYTTTDGTATIANNDYQAVNSGSLTILAGDTTGTIHIKIVGDTDVEPDETFTVTLSNPVGGVLTDNQATGTIINDDNSGGVSCLAVSNEKLLISKYDYDNEGSQTSRSDDLVIMDWDATNSTASNEQSINGNVLYGWLDVAYTPNKKLYATWYNQNFYEVNPTTGSYTYLGKIAGSGNNFELVSDTAGYLYTVGTYNGRQAVIKFLPSTPSNTILVAYVDQLAVGLNLVGDGDLAWSDGILYWTATTTQGVDPTRLFTINTNTGVITNNIIKRASDGSNFVNADAVWNDSQGKLYIAAQDDIYLLDKNTAVATLAYTLAFTPGGAGGATTTYDFCASEASNESPVASIPSAIADYRFDECSWTGASGEVIDSSGNNLNGQSQSGASISSAGKFYRSGQFDGSNDLVRLENNTKLQLVGDMTLSLWVNPNVLSGRQGLIFKHYNNEYEIILESNGSLSFYHGDGGWEEMQEPASAKIAANVWSHVTITRDQTSKTLKWYINGVLQGSDTYVKNPAASSNIVKIGQRDSGAAFSGKIDEVKFFNKTLSDGEILTIYNNEVAGKNYDGSNRTPPSSCTSSAAARSSAVSTVEPNTDGTLTWQSVWVNNGVADAPYVEITAEIPKGTRFVKMPAGEFVSEDGVYCEPRGASANQGSCTYEAPSGEFPQGRVVWRGIIVKEEDSRNIQSRFQTRTVAETREAITSLESSANNEVVLRFITLPTGSTSFITGQSYSDWYFSGQADQDTPPDARVQANDPFTDEPDASPSIKIDASLYESLSGMQPIPTVGEWGMLILGLLMSLMGLSMVRRKRV